MKHISLINRFGSARSALEQRASLNIQGQVVSLAGLALEISGFARHIAVGDQITIASRDGSLVAAEIIGFRDGLAQAMPFGALDGLGPGSTAQAAITGQAPLAHNPGHPPGRPKRSAGQRGALAVDGQWLGRVIDPLGRPLDRKGTLPNGPAWRMRGERETTGSACDCGRSRRGNPETAPRPV